MSLKTSTGSSGPDLFAANLGAESSAGTGPLDLSRPRLAVLLAEGEAIQASRMRRILIKLGHSVARVAHDGREACLLCQEIKPDLLLIDQTLPVMDGLQAAFVVKRNQSLPVVLMASRPGTRLVEEMKSAGVDACLFKPVEPGPLAASLETAYRNFLRIKGLEIQIEEMRREIRTRKLVGRASGILMARHNLSEERAVARLYARARALGVEPAQAARAVIEMSSGQFPCADEGNQK